MVLFSVVLKSPVMMSRVMVLQTEGLKPTFVHLQAFHLGLRYI